MKKLKRVVLWLVPFTVMGAIAFEVVKLSVLGASLVEGTVRAALYGIVGYICIQSVGEVAGMWELRGGYRLTVIEGVRKMVVWGWLVVMKLVVVAGYIVVLSMRVMGKEVGKWEGMIGEVIGFGGGVVLLWLLWIGYEVGKGVSMWEDARIEEVLTGIRVAKGLVWSIFFAGVGRVMSGMGVDELMCVVVVMMLVYVVNVWSLLNDGVGGQQD